MSSFTRIHKILNPPRIPPSPGSNPLKFGILGAAHVTSKALLSPAKSHPEVVIYAIAARSKDRATAFAKEHGIPKVFGGPSGYQEMLDDPEIDAVYNPLPNGLHYEWTMKALAAGKHVLLEKPSSNTAEDTRKMFDFAESKGLVLLEAFHYRFHPVANRVRDIVQSGELGALKHTKTTLILSPGFLNLKGDDPIRYSFDLGGGVLMDMGCYTINAMRFFTDLEPTSVLSVKHELQCPKIDRKTVATFELSDSSKATIHCEIAPDKLVPSMPELNAVIECEKGRIEVFNYMSPSMYHSITVTNGKKRRVEKAYTFPDPDFKGESWWASYLYQLEAFVSKVKGRTPHTWITKEDSIRNMEVIESVYAKVSLAERIGGSTGVELCTCIFWMMEWVDVSVVQESA
ncbi:hypothetical protein R3P38DRAFT_3306947 [Favolaschia claudopus]|uniref:D-xylose 1-dehydrogenase (NADP(+), D-xylono-1,5-lactone-forming) n=1 Tax=Favolaschia claudopus TaxID=2862362 RepID=A0AAW0DGW1_9AGAR